MNYLPIALNLKGKKVIVVGGGKVAQRKIETLLSAGAKVNLIAPEATAKLRDLAEKRRIKFIERKVKKADISRAVLIIAATNLKTLNKRLSSWAKSESIPINVVDKPFLSDFISPALLQKDQALIAVYTDGKNPVLSRDLKNYLGETWDDFLLFRNRS